MRQNKERQCSPSLSNERDDGDADADAATTTTTTTTSTMQETNDGTTVLLFAHVYPYKDLYSMDHDKQEATGTTLLEEDDSDEAIHSQ